MTVTYLNYQGTTYCGTRSNDPNLTGDAETGYIPHEVSCKRCRKKAEKNGLKTAVPFWTNHFDQKKQKNKKSHGSNWINIADRMPPDDIQPVHYFDPEIGESKESVPAYVLSQHIHCDLGMLGYSRTTHWKFCK